MAKVYIILEICKFIYEKVQMILTLVYSYL